MMQRVVGSEGRDFRSALKQIVRQIIDGVDDPEEVLDRMVANGEIANTNEAMCSLFRAAF